MSPQIIKYIIAGVALLIIGVQVMFGAIRGLKKSLFRLVWIFAWGVVCLLISSMIAKAIVNIDISFLHLQFNGEEVSTLPAFIQKMLEERIGENPQVCELALQIAISILNLVVFELLFWVVKYLLYPVWAILAKVFFGKKKKAKSEERNVYIKEKETKPKKHGFLGMLIGIASGIVVAMFAFMPLKTVSDLVVLAEAETTVNYEGATQKGLVSQYAGDYIDYVYVYENSFVNKAFTYTGLGFVQGFGGDFLTKTKYNGTTFTFKNEIKTFGGAYVDFEKIRHYDLQNLTKESIDEIIPLANDLQSRVFSSDFLKSVYENIVPTVVGDMLTKSDYIIKFPTFENELIDKLVKESACSILGLTITETTDTDNNVVKTATYDPTKLTSLNDVKSDATKVLELAKTLNNTYRLDDEDNEIYLIEEFMNNPISFELFQNNLTVEIGENVVGTLFGLNVIDKLVPIIVEPALEELIETQVPTVTYDGVDTIFEFTPLAGAEGLTAKNLGDFLTTSITNAIQVLKNIDLDNSPYIQASDFVKVGEIIDGLRGTPVIDEVTGEQATDPITGKLVFEPKILSTETFDSGINYITAYAKSFVADSEIQEEIKNVLIAMINGLGSVGSYQNELAQVGAAYSVWMSGETISLELMESAFDEILHTDMYDSCKGMLFDNAIEQIEEIDFGPLENVQLAIIDQLNGYKTLDKEHNINIITLLIQMDDLRVDVNAIRYVPDNIDDLKAYLTTDGTGALIDDLTDKYSLIVSDNMKKEIGGFVAEKVNEYVQDSDLPNEYKEAVEDVYNSMTDETSFEELFAQFAEALPNE